MTMQLEHWIINEPVKDTDARVICFSHAGGNVATYMALKEYLPETIDLVGIQYPGRGVQLGSTLCSDFSELVNMICRVLASFDDTPTYFFGHSLGALVAFEVAHQNQDKMNLQQLITSACRPPCLLPSMRVKTMAKVNDDEFLEMLKMYNGIPNELIESPELCELFLPVIQADFRLVANYQYQTKPPLNIPFAVLSGQNDNHALPAEMGQWQDECEIPVDFIQFDGGHFYFNEGDNMKLLAECIVSKVYSFDSMDIAEDFII